MTTTDSPLTFTDAEGNECELEVRVQRPKPPGGLTPPGKRRDAQLPDLIAALSPRGYAVAPVLGTEPTAEELWSIDQAALAAVPNEASVHETNTAALRALFLAGSASREPEVDELRASERAAAERLTRGLGWADSGTLEDVITFALDEFAAHKKTGGEYMERWEKLCDALSISYGADVETMLADVEELKTRAASARAAQERVEELEKRQAATFGQLSDAQYSKGRILEARIEWERRATAAVERATTAEARVVQLEALAYIGEHHFPDLTYKARLAELEATLARPAFKESFRLDAMWQELVRERDEATERATTAEARVVELEAANRGANSQIDDLLRMCLELDAELARVRTELESALVSIGDDARRYVELDQALTLVTGERDEARAKLAECERERDETRRTLEVAMDWPDDPSASLTDSATLVGQELGLLRSELAQHRAVVEAAAFFVEAGEKDYRADGGSATYCTPAFQQLRDALASAGNSSPKPEPAPKPETATQYGDDDPGCEVCGVPTFGARCSKHLHTPEEINAAADAEPAEEEEPKPEPAEMGASVDTCGECGLPEDFPDAHAHALPWRLDSDGKTMLDSNNGSVAEFTTRADAKLAAIRCNASQRDGELWGKVNALAEKVLVRHELRAETVAQGVSRERVVAAASRLGELANEAILSGRDSGVAAAFVMASDLVRSLLAASPDGEQGGGR